MLTSQETTETVSSALTPERVVALAEMRRNLLNLYDELGRLTIDGDWENRSLGRLIERVEEAEHDLFQILNTGKSFFNVEITDDQLFVRR